MYQKVLILNLRGARQARRAMSLLLRELEAFVQEHRRRGELDGGAGLSRSWSRGLRGLWPFGKSG